MRRYYDGTRRTRNLVYDTDGSTHFHNSTGGVPQGSVQVQGPLPWNVLYDGYLRLSFPSGTNLKVLADDIVLVVVTKSIDEIQSKEDEEIETVADVLYHNGISLAAQKTETVFIPDTKKTMYTTFRLEGHKIRSRDIIRYLGVLIDARLSFKDHRKNLGLKAARTAKILGRIMANIRGPK